MRFQDWDVILFPKKNGNKTPTQEFGVSCYLAHDPDFTTSTYEASIPTMTAFIPSQSTGSSFEISVHNWGEPSTDPMEKYIEVRVFIDGKLVALAMPDQNVWPRVIKYEGLNTNDTNGPSTNGSLFSNTNITGHGHDNEAFGSMRGNRNSSRELKFPEFRAETLQAIPWSAADEMGRIKVVLSEGIRRADIPIFERTKNIVVFAFQHAPITYLEDRDIAWPSHRLYERVPMRPNAERSSLQAAYHAHSPRITTAGLGLFSRQQQNFPIESWSPPHPLLGTHQTPQTVVPGLRDTLPPHGRRQNYSSDITMSDYPGLMADGLVTYIEPIMHSHLLRFPISTDNDFLASLSNDPMVTGAPAGTPREAQEITAMFQGSHEKESTTRP